MFTRFSVMFRSCRQICAVVATPKYKTLPENAQLHPATNIRVTKQNRLKSQTLPHIPWSLTALIKLRNDKVCVY